MLIPSGENSLYLAYLLTLLDGILFPKQATIFDLADRVMATLREEDGVYFGHMKECLSQQTSKIEIKVNLNNSNEK